MRQDPKLALRPSHNKLDKILPQLIRGHLRTKKAGQQPCQISMMREMQAI